MAIANIETTTVQDRLNAHYPCVDCAAIEPGDLPLVCDRAGELLDELLDAIERSDEFEALCMVMEDSEATAAGIGRAG